MWNQSRVLEHHQVSKFLLAWKILKDRMWIHVKSCGMRFRMIIWFPCVSIYIYTLKIFEAYLPRCLKCLWSLCPWRSRPFTISFRASPWSAWHWTFWLVSSKQGFRHLGRRQRSMNNQSEIYFKRFDQFVSVSFGFSFHIFSFYIRYFHFHTFLSCSDVAFRIRC